SNAAHRTYLRSAARGCISRGGIGTSASSRCGLNFGTIPRARIIRWRLDLGPRRSLLSGVGLGALIAHATAVSCLLDERRKIRFVMCHQAVYRIFSVARSISGWMTIAASAVRWLPGSKADAKAKATGHYAYLTHLPGS